MIKRDNSANSIISLKCSCKNFLLWPKIAPLRKIFSFAVNSGSNPAPTSINGATFPFTSTLPAEGFKTPANIFNNVLFPAPLKPIIPNISPFLH